MVKFWCKHQLKKLSFQQEGMVLVFSLFALIMVAMWGGSILTISINEYHISNVSKKKVQAYYLAEAGLEEVIARLKHGSLKINDGDYILDNDVIPGGTISVQTRVNLPVITIISTGKVDNSKDTLKGKFLLTYVKEPKISYEGYTVLKKQIGSKQEEINIECLGSLTLENGCQIYGDVYCTGNLTLQKGSRIIGNIYCSGTVLLDNSSKVEGNIYCLYQQGQVIINASDKSIIIMGDVFVANIGDCIKRANNDEAEPQENIAGSIILWKGIPSTDEFNLIFWGEGG